MEQKQKKEIKIVYVFVGFALLLIIIAITMVFGSLRIERTLTNMQESTDAYIIEESSISQMREVSDYLTEKCQSFISTGNVAEAEAYFQEVNKDKRREASLEAVEPYGTDQGIYISLSEALQSSNELAEIECHAMRLAAEGYNLNPADISEGLVQAKLSDEENQMTAQEKRQTARAMVFDKDYESKKDEIWNKVYDSTEQLMKNTRERELGYYKTARSRIILQNALLAFLLVLALLLLIIVARLVILPLRRSTDFIRNHENLPVEGAAEYAYLARSYNTMLESTQEHHEILSYEATHDEMTDLYNRKFFDMKRMELADEETSLMIVDVDHFKSINDTYGHETGDKVLQKVAKILASNFRSEDFVCRIGGDEFAVMMVQMRPELKYIVEGKIADVNEMLRQNGDGLPAVTLSIGVAFSENCDTESENADIPEVLFRNADQALYKVKESGRDGYAFY